MTYIILIRYRDYIKLNFTIVKNNGQNL